MSRLESALRAIALELDGARKAWALVGGLAVSARAEPRFTRDVDLAVATADDGEAEALARVLIGSGYRVLATLEQESAGRLATIRLAAPGEDASGVVVDLLFASSGVELEITREAEVLQVLPGLRVPVARCGHLLALKLLSVSPGAPRTRSTFSLCSARRRLRTSNWRGRPQRSSWRADMAAAGIWQASSRSSFAHEAEPARSEDSAA